MKIRRGGNLVKRSAEADFRGNDEKEKIKLEIELYSRKKVSFRRRIEITFCKESIHNAIFGVFSVGQIIDSDERLENLVFICKLCINRVIRIKLIKVICLIADYITGSYVIIACGKDKPGDGEIVYPESEVSPCNRAPLESHFLCMALFQSLPLHR